MSSEQQAQQPSWKILNPSSFATVVVRLPPNTSIQCESDAVVSSSGNVDMTGFVGGGFLSGLARAFLTRESFFTTRVSHSRGNAAGSAFQEEVMLAPTHPGGLVIHELRSPNDAIFINSGGYVASDETIQITSQMQSSLLRGGGRILSGTGVFLLKAILKQSNSIGSVVIASYGSMHTIVLKAGEKRLVDNGHVVAWTASMPYHVGLASKSGGIFGSLSSGEGLMCFFTGPGVVYVQSHKPDSGDASGKPRQSNVNPVAQICMVFLMLFFFSVLFLVCMYFIQSSQGQFSIQNNAFDNHRYGQNYDL